MESRRSVGRFLDFLASLLDVLADAFNRVAADQKAGREREQGAAKSAAESSNRAADAAAGGALSRRDSAPTAQAQQIGTGHGARRYDPVTQTEFERASWRPNQRVSLYYDSYQALVAKGVIRERYYDYARSPDPFPSGFAPDPQ